MTKAELDILMQKLLRERPDMCVQCNGQGCRLDFDEMKLVQCKKCRGTGLVHNAKTDMILRDHLKKLRKNWPTY
jgi:DnaJ-class molecular chaperone